MRADELDCGENGEVDAGQEEEEYRSEKSANIIELLLTSNFYHLQGEHSGCVKPPFDIKTKVPF